MLNKHFVYGVISAIVVILLIQGIHDTLNYVRNTERLQKQNKRLVQKIDQLEKELISKETPNENFQITGFSR